MGIVVRIIVSIGEHLMILTDVLQKWCMHNSPKLECKVRAICNPTLVETHWSVWRGHQTCSLDKDSYSGPTRNQHFDQVLIFGCTYFRTEPLPNKGKSYTCYCTIVSQPPTLFQSRVWASPSVIASRSGCNKGARTLWYNSRCSSSLCLEEALSENRYIQRSVPYSTCFISLPILANIIL